MISILLLFSYVGISIGYTIDMIPPGLMLLMYQILYII
jgi:hypothetical protein